MNIPVTLKNAVVDDHEFVATTPTRGSAVAAGYDLCAFLPHGTFTIRYAGQAETTSADGSKTIIPCEYSNNSRHIPIGSRALIPTGLSMALPHGWYGRIAPRSGLAWKDGIDVLAGVIDADYRGDIGVVLINFGSTDFVIRHGDRIAQIIIEQCADATLQIAEHLPETTRGESGYGSTGVAKTSHSVIDTTQQNRGVLPKGGFRLSMADVSSNTSV